MRHSAHCLLEEPDEIRIVHKGQFIVGYGSLSMEEFFEYYGAHKREWPLISFNNYQYLVLGRVHFPMTDDDFKNLCDSLAGFADYIPGFKEQYRQ